MENMLKMTKISHNDTLWLWLRETPESVLKLLHHDDTSSKNNFAQGSIDFLQGRRRNCEILLHDCASFQDMNHSASSWDVCDHFATDSKGPPLLISIVVRGNLQVVPLLWCLLLLLVHITDILCVFLLSFTRLFF